MIGCGGVGQSVIQGARIAGASRIFAVDPVEMKRKTAESFGATDLIDPAAGNPVQQVRDATPFGEGPRFLICDNDDKYGIQFKHAVAGAGIELIHTPPYAPKANAICERMIGTLRRELLDRILILNQRPLRQILNAYLPHFNAARPHRALAQLAPAQAETQPPHVINLASHQVHRRPILDGLTSEYQITA